jgi:hypothetical protein
LLAVSSSARAESLAVLGLAGDEDSSFAEALTQALRDDASSDRAVRLSDSRASLSQMTMAQDCDVADAQCRARIGHALGVDQVIYGAVRVTDSGAYEVQLYMFATRGGPQSSATRTIQQQDASGAALARHARSLLNALRGEPTRDETSESPLKTASVVANVNPLAEGEQEPTERAPGHSSSHGSDDWLGYTLLGVAGASLAMTVVSWTQIHSANNDPSLLAYRKAVGANTPGVADVCDEADKGVAHGASAETVSQARSACGKGKTFEVLQYVFLASTVLGAGFGSYFLLNGDQARPDSRVSLQPSIGRYGGGLVLRLHL